MADSEKSVAASAKNPSKKTLPPKDSAAYKALVLAGNVKVSS